MPLAHSKMQVRFWLPSGVQGSENEEGEGSPLSLIPGEAQNPSGPSLPLSNCSSRQLPAFLGATVSSSGKWQ